MDSLAMLRQIDEEEEEEEEEESTLNEKVMEEEEEEEIAPFSVQEKMDDEGGWLNDSSFLEAENSALEEEDSLNTNMTNDEVHSEDNIQEERPKPSLLSNVMFQEDLIQCWSPGVAKNRRKSRIQPKRKSTSKKIDYSDKKKRKRKSCRLMKLKKSSPNKVPRVTRRSVLEIGKMKKLRKQTRENRLRNEKNMKLALMHGGYQPVRSVNVTKPKEFNFSIRDKERGTRGGGITNAGPKPFESGLRKDAVNHDFKNKNTMPVPFNFKLSQKTGGAKKWESVAQATMKFQTKTPTRFRSKPSEEDRSILEGKSEKKEAPHVTLPVTPKLRTTGRTRRHKVESTQEQEEKIVEEMKNFRFKATELNPKIMDSKGMYGVKEVPAVASTHPEPFDFEIEQRISNRPGKDTTLTEEDTSVNIKSKTTTTSSGRLKPTQPKPFSFESKDKERYSKKEEKIKEHILAEKKLAEFQASLLPSFSPDALPSVPTRKRTRMKPFNISTGSLSYQTKLETTMKCEQLEERSRRQFKAQSAKVVKKAPFKPTTGLNPPTKVSKKKLNTDARAEEREMQQFWKKQKENMEEEERKQREEEERLKEEEEVKKLRKEMVHKAKGIPNFKPLDITKSEIPLTVPETPNLQVKQRALARLESSRLESSRLESSRLESSRLESSRLENSRLQRSRLVVDGK